MMTDTKKKITVRPNGSYKMEGGIPLVRKRQVVSEYGEPLTWQKEMDIPAEEFYSLCRCGESATKPFCDGTHKHIAFDGTETADTRPTAERQVTIEGGTGIVVKRDHSLCMDSGYCCNQKTNIRKLTPQTGEGSVRAELMAMIERCPSGSYVYSLEEGGPDIEPDYPQQIALTTEITSGGPIEGPLWVTGGIEIERSDGQPFETRNRVTLCNCGHSKIKPLCDGTHRRLAEKKQKEGKPTD
jgi:CDGSH-type Zn-finger protein